MASRGDVTLALLLLAASGRERFVLFDASDPAAKSGIVLALENEGAPELRVGELRLVLRVGDGSAWRTLTGGQTFEIGRSYRIRAEIAKRESRLLVDGGLVAAGQTAYRAAPGPATAGASAGDGGGYDAVLTRVGWRGKGATASRVLPASAPGARLFIGAIPIELAPPPEPPFAVEAEVRIERRGEAAGSAPLVDRYGQARFLDWPGKATDDAGLGREHDAEIAELERLAKELPPTDRFGGRIGKSPLKATGYYRVERIGKRWRLVSPEGNPLFYSGVSTAPSPTWDRTPVTGREGLFAETPPADAEVWAEGDWGEAEVRAFAPHAPWLRRREGADWRAKVAEEARLRTRALGFSGYGKWSEGGGKVAELPVLRPKFATNGLAHLDPFDPAARAAGMKEISSLVAPRRSDPYVVGWSVGNEYDEIIRRSEIVALLARTDGPKGKRALLDATLAGPYGGDAKRFAEAYGGSPATLGPIAVVAPEGDLEGMRVRYEDAYFAFLREAVKAADPDHLYLGTWISYGWWESPADWALGARYADVVGYDRYAPSFADEGFRAALAALDKPVLLGEFSFPPTYDGARGFGRYFVSVRDEEEAGRAYGRTLAEAAGSGVAVGAVWFQYRDQPILGRGDPLSPRGAAVRGEHYAFGLVDGTDRLKWPLARAMRSANLEANREAAEQTGLPGTLGSEIRR